MTVAMEIEPEKFRPQYKVHKIFRVGGKTTVGRVSGNIKILLGPIIKTNLHTV